MSKRSHDAIDPNLDLVLERTVDVPPQLVWRAWTEPALVTQWFTPAPWTTVDCEIDLRPGGLFRTVMRSPEGQDHENIGCYLDIVETSGWCGPTCSVPGYRPRGGGLGRARPTADSSRPSSCSSPPARARATSRASCTAPRPTARSHEDMGFHEGWGAALDQLVAMAKRM